MIDGWMERAIEQQTEWWTDGWMHGQNYDGWMEIKIE